jgi:uncharacterized metal-binding protein YceD (DUF177 family)
MAPGLPDRVDCVRLAEEAAVLERVFTLADLPRLQDLLAEPSGSVSVRYAFDRVDGSRAGATIAVEAAPQLLCQRCLMGFAFPVSASSEIEFASSESAAPADSLREIYVMTNGLVSLRELAEEELLLALPVIAACTTPESCGRAPTLEADTADAPRRPFAGLQELLKKT